MDTRLGLGRTKFALRSGPTDIKVVQRQDEVEFPVAKVRT